jgi:predicted Zn finger-like uncharacterized protein
MPLEVSCPSCSGHFRVPDSAAGKKIRCPKCKGAIEVPAAPAASPAAPAPRKPRPQPQPQPERWFLKSEEGEDYGPVPRTELDAWRAEGRVTADCQLLREGSDQWQWAGEVYADLNPAAEPEPASASSPAKTQPTTAKKQPAASPADPADDRPLSTRSRPVAGLLGIFLGPLGTHRFYLGYWVIGLIMLATGGVCGVWSLIDAILVLLGKVPDADGRRLG